MSEEISKIRWTRKLQGKCPCGSGQYVRKCCFQGHGRWRKSEVLPLIGELTSFSHSKCYLNRLGNCGTKLSKEHFISRAILDRITDGPLRFSDAEHFFGSKGDKIIGKDGFSAKVLCDRHNSALSPLDEAATQAFEGNLDIETALITAPEERILSVFRLASGFDLERWLIKVFCGLASAGKIKRGSGAAIEAHDIDNSLIECLVNGKRLEPPLGMYVEAVVGQQRQPGTFLFATIKLIDGSDQVGGILLNLGIVNLVLVTNENYGLKFRNEHWSRHQRKIFDVNQHGKRTAYMFTY